MSPDWSPEFVVSDTLAQTLIAEQFPHLKPVAVKKIGEGFDNTIFAVNEMYIFRFPRKQFAEGLLSIEKKLLPSLYSRLPVSIPNPIHIGSSTESYPWMFLGYSYVEGEVPALAEDEVRMMSAPILASFLKTLHAQPREWAERVGVPVDPIKRLNIRERLPKLKHHIHQAYLQNVLEPCAALDECITSLHGLIGVPFSNDTLVHGDLHIRNVLVDEKGVLSGIIDWGDTHIGHPAIDLGFVYAYLPPEGREEFFRIYGQVGEATQKMAVFFAVYVSIVQVLYGHDQGDTLLVHAAKDSLKRVLNE
ncbi:phosphotransferase [Pontibacillus salicampi]|uniref:Phosphotransferase n=1 Tax=Pontibacillus salicampi TaxID=1449801 RepID=A0ABV6LPT6_9BACI